jgi:hypothetical protein
MAQILPRRGGREWEGVGGNRGEWEGVGGEGLWLGGRERDFSVILRDFGAKVRDGAVWGVIFA